MKKHLSAKVVLTQIYNKLNTNVSKKKFLSFPPSSIFRDANFKECFLFLQDLFKLGIEESQTLFSIHNFLKFMSVKEFKEVANLVYAETQQSS